MKFLKYFEKNIIDTDRDLKKILNGNDVLDIDDVDGNSEFLKIKKLIERDCQPVLGNIKNSVMMRGTEREDESLSIIKKTVRKDRRALSFTPEFQELFDDIFEEKFGARPRSGGVFCSKNAHMARSYGNIYIVFPIGEYKAFWMRGIQDLYVQKPKLRTDDYMKGFDVKYLYELYGKPTSKDVEERRAWVVEHDLIAKDEYREELSEYISKYREGDIDGLINEEIMVVTDEYYMVNIKYVKFIIDWLGLDKVNEKLHIKRFK